MYRLCLASVVLFALGSGTSLAQGTSAPAADDVATIDSPAPSSLDASSTADSASKLNAESSSARERGAQSARATKRAARRHATPSPTETAEAAPIEPATAAPTEPVQIEPAKTVEIKDIGERTVCEDVGLPGSRIVVGKRCHTYNIYDKTDMKMAEEKKEQTKRAIREVQRMQDNLELEQRQREWDRERAIAAMVVGAH